MGTPELLDRQCSRGKQSLDMTSLWQVWPGTATLPTHKLRVRRVRDSYDFQSFARVERWDGAQWRELAAIPFAMMGDASYGEDAADVNNGGLESQLAYLLRSNARSEEELANIIKESKANA